MNTCQGCGTEIPPSRGGPARKWCSERCRRHHTYVHHCIDCGTRLNSGEGNGPRRPVRCIECHGLAKAVWTREKIIDAIGRWAQETGSPPSASDWDLPERRGDGAWPYSSIVRARFGSWNAAIAAAGFTPRRIGTYGRPGESLELCREVRERYEAGESAEVLGRAYGVGARTIAARVRRAGGHMRSQREAYAARLARVAP